MENKTILIKRVPIEAVLDILHQLYDRGVDFVDFHGKVEGDEDVLGISFAKDYMDPEYAQEFDEFNSEELSNEDINVKLTDDDINKLL